MKLAPRGGTITPVVERCDTISAADSARAAPPDSSAAAPATPAPFRRSGRVCPSIAHILSHLAGIGATRDGAGMLADPAIRAFAATGVASMAAGIRGAMDGFDRRQRVTCTPG